MNKGQNNQVPQQQVCQNNVLNQENLQKLEKINHNDEENNDNQNIFDEHFKNCNEDNKNEQKNDLDYNEVFQEELLKYDIQEIENIYDRIIRFIFGVVSGLCTLFDMFLLKKLKQLEQDLLKKEINDYQFDFFVLVLIINLFLGHFFGISKKENPQFPQGKFNKVGKIILRIFNIVGLSHYLYLIYSAIAGVKSQDFDKFNIAPLGTRRYWAHWHSVIVLYIYSHYMFVTDTDWFIGIGFAFNVGNIIFSFIDYTDYQKCPNHNHIVCEKCLCTGKDSLKKKNYDGTVQFETNVCINANKFVTPQYQDSKKNKVTVDYNSLRCPFGQEPQQFYYKCGCPQHAQYLCEKCYQKDLSHTNNSILKYLWHQNYTYILLIPEVIGKPLFFGSISLVYVKESLFFNYSPIRFSYDFFIMDCILLLMVLALPYFKIIITPSKKQMSRLTSLVAFYIFYFIQIIRNPFKDHIMLQSTQQVLVLKDKLDYNNMQGIYSDKDYTDPNTHKNQIKIDLFNSFKGQQKANYDEIYKFQKVKYNIKKELYSQTNDSASKQVSNILNNQQIQNEDNNYIKENNNNQEIKKDIDLNNINNSGGKNQQSQQKKNFQQSQINKLNKQKYQKPSQQNESPQKSQSKNQYQLIQQNTVNEKYSQQMIEMIQEVKKQNKSHYIDQYGFILDYLMAEDNNQSEKLRVISNMIPKVIYFLGIFPFLWRFFEFLALFIAIYTSLFFLPLDRDIPKNQQSVVLFTFMINGISILTYIFFGVKYYLLKERILKIQKDFEKREELHSHFHKVINKQHKSLYEVSTLISVIKKPEILEEELKLLSQQDNMEGVTQLCDSIKTMYHNSLSNIAKYQILFEDTKQQAYLVKYHQSKQFNDALHNLMQQNWFQNVLNETQQNLQNQMIQESQNLTLVNANNITITNIELQSAKDKKDTSFQKKEHYTRIKKTGILEKTGKFLGQNGYFIPSKNQNQFKSLRTDDINYTNSNNNNDTYLNNITDQDIKYQPQQQQDIELDLTFQETPPGPQQK